MSTIKSPALADNLFQAAWTAICVTLLHAAVYRVAHKDLRVWVAVNESSARRKEGHAIVVGDQIEGPGGKSEEEEGPRYLSRPITNTPRRHPMIEKLRKYIEPVSLAAPILLSIIFQFIVYQKGYLDWVIILIVYALLTFAITSILALFEDEVAVVPWPNVAYDLHGWCVTDATRRMHPIGDLNFDAAWKIVPGVSLALCSAIILANQAPHSAVYAVLMVAMTMLGPICFLRLTRGADMKMKGPLMMMGFALGVFALLVLLLLLPATRPSDDPQEPEKEPDTFNRMVAVVLSVVGKDLARVIQYAQYGFVFSQTVSLLRFDYEQSRNQSPFECEAPLFVQSGKQIVVTEDTAPAQSDFEPSTSRTAARSKHVFIPARLPPFSAPTFKGSIIGSYLCTIIAVLLFPTPELCILWLVAAFVGQSLGMALSVTWNKQWKALWRYEEV
ncbi:hypothetical protein QFC21_004011 [Naganishia friedmannii]|uniref:Uncharacterized protein n=1 Tax=Naganishia friedmannii TaxID=89922 RepID=A0ACC2VJN5_9TREE|nr:hypothetical protein QFC21_004011 [Naganishia friedmannii]